MEDLLPLGFTGFYATLSNGKSIMESSSPVIKEEGLYCATNWGSVPLDKLSTLFLVHRGRKVASLSAVEDDIEFPSEWYYSRTAQTDSRNWESTILYRNIGYWRSGDLYLKCMHEPTGTVHTEILPGGRR